MAFVIVKYADDGIWGQYYEDDPKLGVDRTHSAHGTHSGKLAGIANEYSSIEEALPDLHKLVELNPIGGYAICPVLY